MKIILTGSLGNIGRPLTEQLVKRGHAVTVITSKSDRQKDIETLGATAAIGSVEDAAFLTTAFTGADAVYTMVPPANYFDPNFDVRVHCRKLGHIFAQAIRESGVQRVIHLSSIGAHLSRGSGLILGHYDVESILEELSDVDITFMRPVGFFYNLLGFIPAIKHQGLISANYGADEMLAWVSPIDIAAAIAKEFDTTPVRRKVTYVASDELTGHETARILGEAIGIPDLKWVLVSDAERQRTLEGFGLNQGIAAGLVEMFACQHNGRLLADYYLHKPPLGKIKCKDFAKQFAAAFNQK